MLLRKTIVCVNRVLLIHHQRWSPFPAGEGTDKSKFEQTIEKGVYFIFCNKIPIKTCNFAQKMLSYIKVTANGAKLPDGGRK